MQSLNRPRRSVPATTPSPRWPSLRRHQPQTRARPPLRPINSASTDKEPPRLAYVVDPDVGDVMAAPWQPRDHAQNVADLLPSLTKIGQQVPGDRLPNPDRPSPGSANYLCADGNRHLLACTVTGRKYKAIVLDHPPSKAELRRIRVTTNVIRKGMKPAEIAAEIEEHMAETGDNLRQTAEFLGITTGYASRLIAPDKRLCPELHHLLENKAFCRDALRIIATMPTPELQKKLAEKALATLKAGGTIKRNNVQDLADTMKGEKRPKQKR